jgi:hypothetical protein
MVDTRIILSGLSVPRNGSQWIARSGAFLPDLMIQQEQTAVYLENR